MVRITLVTANLAATFMESFLYGIFFVSSITSVYLLVNRRRVLFNPGSHGVNHRSLLTSPLFLATISLFTTVTAHWIVTVIRLFQAFLFFESGPLAFYSDLRQPTGVVNAGLMMTSICIGDAVIIYRLFVIWNYNRPVIIFPVCTFVCLVVSVVLTVQSSLSVSGGNVYVAAVGRWVTLSCIFTFCTNVYSTGMISVQVWSVNKTARQSGHENLMSVLNILIESVAIYTFWGIIYFATYQSGSNLQVTANDTLCTITGITFMLINVRVGLGWAYKAHQPSVQDAIPMFISQPGENARPRHGDQLVAVGITHIDEQHDDNGTENTLADDGYFNNNQAV